MFINPVTTPVFTAKIPLSEYKGPILKLTKKDKELIAHYTNERSLLELEMLKLSEVYRSFKTYNIDSGWYSDKVLSLEADIEKLERLIKEVKVNRLKKQAESLSK